MALCERDMGIYGAILLFGIVYSLTGRRIKPLHWMLWILIGLGPIGLDGFSQLFSQMEWSWLASILPYRESTPFLRVLTGGLFGLTTAWFAYPYMEESMAETRQFFIKKFESIRQNKYLCSWNNHPCIPALCSDSSYFLEVVHHGFYSAQRNPLLSI